jgi:hypothetical protein
MTTRPNIGLERTSACGRRPIPVFWSNATHAPGNITADGPNPNQFDRSSWTSPDRRRWCRKPVRAAELYYNGSSRLAPKIVVDG